MQPLNMLRGKLLSDKEESVLLGLKTEWTFSAIKRSKLPIQATTWMRLKNIMPSNT